MKPIPILKVHRKLEKLHINQWAVKHGTSYLCTTLAQNFAVLGNELYDLLKRCHRRALDVEFPPRPKRDDWLAMYESPLPPGATAELSSVFGIQSLLEPISGKYERPILNTLKKNPTNRKLIMDQFVRQLRQLWCDHYPPHLQALFEQLSRPMDPKTREIIDEQIRTIPSVHFAMSVYWPAFFLFQRTPHQLLIEARNGSDEALAALVQIDPQFATSEEVDRWIFDNGGKTRRVRRNDVAQWMAEGVIGRFGRTGFLSSLAALVSSISHRLNFAITKNGVVSRPLSAAAIREVFDAAMMDEQSISPKWYGRIRSALPVGTNLAKEIWRKRERWDQHFLLMQGQKSSEVLSGG